MSEFDYDQELAKARSAAVGLQGELEGLVLGKTLPGFGCGCGAISHGEAKAVAIVLAGNEYEYQITDPILWTVDMQETSGSGKGYGIGLSSFLPRETIQEMFDRHFEGIDSEAIQREYFARKNS